MHRHLEFIGGNSAKFWETTVKGNCCTVRYGRIGTAGQSQTKTLPNHAAAVSHAEKLVKQKLAKGYAETTAA